MFDPRTVALICEALMWLAKGEAVIIVAHPTEEVRRIGRRILALANALGIPHHTNKSGDDGPMIRFRAYQSCGEIPVPLPKLHVLIDHSAVFEKTMTPPTRTVITERI